MVEKKNPQQPKHQKNQGINMESMAPDTIYAFTFNPIDTRGQAGIGSRMIQKNETETDRVLLEQLDVIKNYLRKMKFCSFEVYPELSKNGRLHVHGFIMVHNILQFYYHDLHLLNQYVYEIDTINEETKDTYDKYVFKQKSIWLPFCEKHGYSYKIESKK